MPLYRPVNFSFSVLAFMAVCFADTTKSRCLCDPTWHQCGFLSGFFIIENPIQRSYDQAHSFHWPMRLTSKCYNYYWPLSHLLSRLPQNSSHSKPPNVHFAWKHSPNITGKEVKSSRTKVESKASFMFVWRLRTGSKGPSSCFLHLPRCFVNKWVRTNIW